MTRIKCNVVFLFLENFIFSRVTFFFSFFLSFTFGRELGENENRMDVVESRMNRERTKGDSFP